MPVRFRASILAQCRASMPAQSRNESRTMKKYDDDDGRTVADMSGIEQQPMLMPSLEPVMKEK